MGFKQSPFPMIDGTTQHKSATKKKSPNKLVGKLIDVGVQALKEDTARQERANNRYIDLATLPGGLNAVL